MFGAVKVLAAIIHRRDTDPLTNLASHRYFTKVPLHSHIA